MAANFHRRHLVVDGCLACGVVGLVRYADRTCVVLDVTCQRCARCVPALERSGRLPAQPPTREELAARREIRRAERLAAYLERTSRIAA